MSVFLCLWKCSRLLQDGAPYIIYYYYAIITAMLGALSFENDKNVQYMKSLSSFAGFLS